MAKRGRKASSWVWDWFKDTGKKNDDGHKILECIVPTGKKDEAGKTIVCCDNLVKISSPSSFERHLSQCHREWYAEHGLPEPDQKRAKPATLDSFLVLKEDPTTRVASAEEQLEMNSDILSYVVDDLRPVSSVEGINNVLVFSIPASSAPSERIFSKYGVVWEKRRANLKPETASDIIFLHELRKVNE